MWQEIPILVRTAIIFDLGVVGVCGLLVAYSLGKLTAWLENH